MKSLRLFFSVVILLLSIVKIGAADQNDGMVLYLPFDELPSAGVYFDKSGFDNHASSSGVSFSSNSGRIGGAVQFSGNAYIRILKNASLNVGTADEFTMMAWYKTSAGESPLIEWSDGFGGPSGRAGVHLWANALGSQWHDAFVPGQGGGTGGNIVAAGVPWPTNEQLYVVSADDKPRNEWHHVAVTYNRIAGLGQVYIDGEQLQTRSFSVTPDTDKDIFLGTRPTDTQRLQGFLDEVRIYNRGLSPAEIKSIYSAASTGKVYQNFELGNGSSQYGWAFNGATVVQSTQQIRPGSGLRNWKITSPGQFGGTGIASQVETFDFKAHPDRHDRLTFWIWADPQNQGPNDVGVKFFDQENYKVNGFEIYTTRMTNLRVWTQLEVLFSQLPADFNLNRIDKIEFVNFWPGTYYLDDIQLTAKDRMYQDFEPDQKQSNNAPLSCYASDPTSWAQCGWSWFGNVSVNDQTVAQKTQSWKIHTTDFFGGSGIKSREKRLFVGSEGNCPDPNNPNPFPGQPTFQDFWHVDLKAPHLGTQGYDRLTFRLYSHGDNQMDNNLGVQFFDWCNYNADPIPAGFYDKQVVWSREGGINDKWTQVSIPFSALPADFRLENINKLQFQFYWTGDFYLDEIKAGKPAPVIDQVALPTGTLKWSRSADAARYVLEDSVTGPDGPWTTRYTGTNNTFIVPQLTDTWYRVRWETIPGVTGTEAYISDWSEVAAYNVQPALLKHARLQQGFVEVKTMPTITQYEIQTATVKMGPWSAFFSGTYTGQTLPAVLGRYYRVRALRTGQTPGAWSPALQYNPTGYVKAIGTVFKEQNGSGDVISLRGTNLGNALLIEPWMFFGLNHPSVKKPGEQGYNAALAINDDWTFRDILTQRFGGTETANVMRAFQEAYLQESDFDKMMRLGFNVVRLPVYYRDIRELNPNQTWAGATYNFTHIDRLIQFAADRGMYVLLDLHGAPGSQSEQDNTGRFGFNKLFATGEPGACQAATTLADCYQTRTVELWGAIATRYRTNPVVVGYDLLNEPTGAPNPPALWTLYDRLYDAIRAVDNNHMIMMEGLWVDQNRWPTVQNDWDWLPNPTQFSWQNVAYQFHFYCWDCATDPGPDPNPEPNPDPDPNPDPQPGPPPVPALPASQVAQQQAFLDNKYADADAHIYEYNVPLMIGEFSGFGVRQVWSNYLTRFNQYGWSWTNWAYKTYDSPSEWGLYTHLLYPGELPDIRLETLDAIKKKVGRFDTAGNHIANVSLNSLVKIGATQTVNQPPVMSSIGDKAVSARSLLSFTVQATDANNDGRTYTATPLPAGATLDFQSGQFNWTPTDAQIGAHVVKFVASDGFLKDQELITITVAQAPDLTISALTGPAGLVLGTTTSVNVTVNNLGGSAGGSAVRFYLSLDPVITAADIPIGTKTIPQLAGGASSAMTASVVIPDNINVGVYYVGAIADDNNVVVELDENNNTRATAATIPVNAIAGAITWKDLLGVSVSGNTITKTAGTAWGNAGAASILAISGDGGVEVLADQSNTSRMFGLSNANPDANYTTNKYGLYLVNNATVQVYELGVLRGSFGNYAVGDRFEVVRTGGQVRYQKNGVTFYTSTVPSTGTVVFDAALYTMGAKVTDAKLWGGVQPSNTPPVAIDQSVTTAYNTPLAITLTATDVDSNPLTFNIFSGPSHGTVTGTGANRTYTPTSGYVGSDSFTFRANDGTVDSTNIGLISIQVRPPMVPIVWKDTLGVSVAGNTITKTAATAWGNAGAASTHILVSDGGVEVLADQTTTQRMFGLSNANPDANYTSNKYAVYLNGATVMVYESGVSRGSFGTYVIGDRFSVARTAAQIQYQKNGVTFYTSTVSSNGNLLFDAALYTSGAKVTDAKMWGGGSPPNSQPAALNQSLTTPFNTPLAITLTATDADNDPLTFTIVTQPASGVLSGSGANRTYTPNVGFVGSDSFTFRANDGQSDSNPATISIEVRPAMTPITAWKDQVGVSVAGNSLTKTAATGWNNGGAASLQVIAGNGGVEVLADQTTTQRMFGLSNSNPDANYTTNKYAVYLSGPTVLVYESGASRGSFGTYVVGDRFSVVRTGTQIQYQKNGVTFYTSAVASTGNLLFDAALYTVGSTVSDAKMWGGILPPNSPPVAQAQSLITAFNTALPITLTATDVENNPLTYSIVTQPLNGTLSGTGANRTYTPNNGYVGSDSFSFKANDGQADSNTATVSIQIRPAMTNVIWQDLIGVTVAGNTITKTAATAWSNGGAASQQTIAANGGVEVLADQTTTQRMFGLSNTNPDANYTTNKYAIYLLNNATVQVYESGVSRGLYGSYVNGDRFAVVRTGTQIQYQKNGVTFYSSTVASTGSLLVDAALYTVGSKITDAKVW